MTVRILVAPAGGGKTRYAVGEARRMARGLRATPYVLVASALQAQAFRRRLAQEGGAIGVRVLTFEGLYRLCLSGTGQAYTKISDPVQHRVIRSVVRELPLVHYAPLTARPGFVQVLKDLMDKLKAARIDPAFFATAVAVHGGELRLQELAEIYAVYQERLQAEGWADAAGLGWLTAEALEDSGCQTGKDWPLLLVDGFDDFTSVQLAVLAPMAERVERMEVTLTGVVRGEGRPLVHRRFDRTRRKLEETLGIAAEPLLGAKGEDGIAAGQEEAGAGSNRRLDLPGRLFRSEAERLPADGSLALIEAANRAEEARAALRWLKAELVQGGMRPSQTALLARDVKVYRPFVRQVAAEFGLPIHFDAGEPLKENPAVAALMDLLRLMLPAEDSAVTAGGESGPGGEGEAEPGWPEGEPQLPPRLVIEAWRSPYLDWRPGGAEEEGAATGPDEGERPIGIQSGDADALGMIVRRGRVIGGPRQWDSAFEAVEGVVGQNGSTRSPTSTWSPRSTWSPEVTESPQVPNSPGSASEPRGVLSVDELDLDEGEFPARTLTASSVKALHGKFTRFVERLRPPQGEHSARRFVSWLETLIGLDPELPSRRFSPLGFTARRGAPGLNVVAQIRQGDPGLVERDIAALRCLKEVLRGLAWAEEALESPPMRFSTFVRELTGAIEAVVYHLPRAVEGDEILIANLVTARGVPFRSVAVMGMAEGFFPASHSEDALLHDADREALGLPLPAATESAEAEYFYETVAAPADRLLLTRPHLAEDGAPWEPSPFWEEVVRLVDVTPGVLQGTSALRPERAASLAELLQAAAVVEDRAQVWRWLREHAPASVAAVDRAVEVHTWRTRGADSAFDGGLAGLGDHFTEELNRDYAWSASRLEAYRLCPFHFFVGKVLGLEPREDPREGLDVLQLGILYHGILERVYRAVDDPADLEELLQALPGVARAVLDEAPWRLGFRETAWWDQTRREIVEDVGRTLEALHEDELRGAYIPVRYEAAFGLRGERPLVVGDARGEDAFLLRGLIDRVDLDGQGRVRVIDYKTGGPWGYSNIALRRGEKIQLGLYALAARDALGLGEPASGFYWHVRHAEPSALKLEEFGPREAMGTAVAHAWEAIRSAREGHFRPVAPPRGCPSYCPAAAFCWHYEPGYGR